MTVGRQLQRRMKPNPNANATIGAQFKTSTRGRVGRQEILCLVLFFFAVNHAFTNLQQNNVRTIEEKEAQSHNPVTYIHPVQELELSDVVLILWIGYARTHRHTAHAR